MGLFGYGKYSYSFSVDKITPPNPAILVFAIPMILPYLIKSFVDYLASMKLDNESSENKKVNTLNLLENGICQEIFFKSAVIEIYETKVEENMDFEFLKEELLFPWNDLFKNKIEVITVVKLMYKSKGKKYFKKIIFPFTQKNSEICLKTQKSTFLFYEENAPENAIVDLKFLEENI